MKLDDLYFWYFVEKNSDIKNQYNKYHTDKAAEKKYKENSFVCTLLLKYKNNFILWRNIYKNNIYSECITNCVYLNLNIL